jgi:hypothetical protein
MFLDKRVMAFVTVIALNLALISQRSKSMYAVYGSESLPYVFGYDHTTDDAGISDPNDGYINRPGKGSILHTQEFISRYDSYEMFYCSDLEVW